ncbi:MAG: hypothetical protein A2Y40_04475 [Candidatus Margulisbacteria bacterium GWF2_35_9]|nr:MAG: hypothetical protein A2Y40_04475 [Candidatus Margulisbacteria bacterium GWF2_35_9]
MFISFFGVATPALFWACCNDSFSEKEAVAFYGFVGLGGILGGLAGGIVTNYLVKIIGTESLLFVCAGILLIAVPFPYLLIGSFHGERKKVLEDYSKKTVKNGFQMVITERHIRVIAVIVISMTIIATFFDFQYQGIINQVGLAKDIRTALFAKIFTYINIVGIVIHLVFTRFILKHFGPLGGLLPLPIISLVALIMLKLYPNLNMVVFFWALLGGITYSLQQVSKENLYVPLSRFQKYVSKAYIDTFIYRAGDGIAGIYLMVLAFMQIQSRSNIFWSTIVLIGIWLYFIISLNINNKSRKQEEME